MEATVVKIEPKSEENYVLVDEIKVEEPSIQYETTNSNFEEGPSVRSVVVEKQMYVCSSCGSAFERNDNVTLRKESDFNKCNKCILHSKLNLVFSSKPFTKLKQCRRAQRKKPTALRKSMEVEESVPQLETEDCEKKLELRSLIVKKTLFICSSCSCAFERKKIVRMHDSSDKLKCNKCILHSRLSTAFGSRKQLSKCPNCPFTTQWSRSYRKHVKWHCKGSLS